MITNAKYKMLARETETEIQVFQNLERQRKKEKNVEFDETLILFRRALLIY